jgi:outer membrane autotransporter protein
VDGTYGSMYFVKRLESLYFSGIAGVDTFSNKEQRYAYIPGSDAPLVPVSGYAENLQGKFSSQSASGQMEIGWDQDYGRVRVTPFMDLQFDALRMNGFTESGLDGSANTLGLSYKERTVNSMPIFLGTQADAQIIKKDNTSLIGSLRMAWKHETESCRSIDADFIAAPGEDFVIYGVTAPRNALRLDTGLSLMLNDHLSLFGNFGGEYYSGANTNEGTGGVKYNW